MSAREVYLNAIVEQFNTLPFQIPPTNPVVQPFRSTFTSVITIPASSSFYAQTITLTGVTVNNKKIAVSCSLVDGVDYTNALPFGLLSWTPDVQPTIILDFWNESGIDKDVRVEIVAF